MTTRGLALVLAFGLLVTVAMVQAQCGWDIEGTESGPSDIISEGTLFLVRLDDKLPLDKLKPGKQFKVKLGENLMAPNGTLIELGSWIKGHVGSVGQGTQGRIVLLLDSIQIQRNWIPLSATVVRVTGRPAKSAAEGGEVEQANLKEENKSASSGPGIDRNVTLDKGQYLEVQLDRPLTVPKA